MKTILLCIFIITNCSLSYASGKKEEKKKEQPKKEQPKKKEEKKKEAKKEPANGEKKGEPKKEEPKKEEKKKAPPEPKAVRDFKEQEAQVKQLRGYIKADEKEIEKCKKGKDISAEEKLACPRNIDYYKTRIERSKLRLHDAELKLRTMEKDAKKRMEEQKEKSGH
jgi:hypothetical protein